MNIPKYLKADGYLILEECHVVEGITEYIQESIVWREQKERCPTKAGWDFRIIGTLDGRSMSELVYVDTFIEDAPVNFSQARDALVLYFLRRTHDEIYKNARILSPSDYIECIKIEAAETRNKNLIEAIKQHGKTISSSLEDIRKQLSINNENISWRLA